MTIIGEEMPQEVSALIERLRTIAEEIQERSFDPYCQRARDVWNAADRLEAVTERTEALRKIKAGSTLGKQLFAQRVNERKGRLTWYAVNVLQDNLDACFGTADAALSKVTR